MSGPIDEVSIHHTVSPNRDWTKQEEYEHLQAIYDYHTAPGTFDPDWIAPGIGYWFLVFPSANIYQVGGLSDQRASVGGQNDHIVGVALVGDFMVGGPGADQLGAARWLWKDLERSLGRTLALRPHYHYGNTSCPGDTFPTWPW